MILIDPPWRIKETDNLNSKFMFPNSQINLNNNAMSHEEIMNMQVDKLSKKGKLFFSQSLKRINIYVDRC